MKDIVSDKFDERETSHMKLKLNHLENEDYLCGSDFTKPKLMEMGQAYGVNCASSMKKGNIA